MAAPSPSAPRPARTARVVLVALIAVGLTLLGAALWVESRSASNEWFAYAPLSGTTYEPGGSSLNTAALLSGAGALLLGGAVGFVVGRRSQPAAK